MSDNVISLEEKKKEIVEFWDSAMGLKVKLDVLFSLVKLVYSKNLSEKAMREVFGIFQRDAVERANINQNNPTRYEAVVFEKLQTLDLEELIHHFAHYS